MSQSKEKSKEDDLFAVIVASLTDKESVGECKDFINKIANEKGLKAPAPNKRKKPAAQRKGPTKKTKPNPKSRAKVVSKGKVHFEDSESSGNENSEDMETDEDLSDDGMMEDMNAGDEDVGDADDGANGEGEDAAVKSKPRRKEFKPIGLSWVEESHVNLTDE